MEITLTVERSDGSHAQLGVGSPNLVVAGFTGRDSAAVERHVRELVAHGVPAPGDAPCYWILPNWLLAVEPSVIQVASSMTSGEVEPVLVCMPDGESYLTVGSDHTDRELERASLGLGKLACPKIIAATVWPFDDVRDGWDEIRLRSTAGDAFLHYQDDCLGSIKDPAALLAGIDSIGLDRSRPLIAFLGTVPLVDGKLVFSGPFAGILEDRVGSRSIAIEYRVEELLDGSGFDVAASLAGGSE